MKKIVLILLLSLFANAGISAAVKLKGKIGGKYGIEMELEASKDAKNPIQGKYHYDGKTTDLTLKGVMYGDYVVYLEEYNSEGKNTGSFYLSYEEKKWSGKWTGTEKYFDVELTVQSGDMSQFKEFDMAELQKKCSSSLTGSYAYDYYFLNDMWLQETGNMEVGFNGGVVSVKEVHKDTLEIRFELLCGPTYHIAYFDGDAVKTGKNQYEFNTALYEGEEACHLVFTFTEKKVTISQKSSSMDCEFGARAYADGDFTKISDKISTKETVGIEDVLKLK
ncbi:MAG: hypothetical protein KDC84_03615 [Crocinitomicaceae bacterium]|nr:hypothetical protein [Crocinitomicaceae bacterium]